MIINSAPANEAIISNVGEIGEFRIRNSAKAFNILSSGLYANKVRAIIRELSCNAVDSHVAAGKQNTPFDVHLPNQLEPWFSIRDYGIGLSHEQVINIYTTYFESTKTESNEFIGALGLGSKSPFSYTDNFTVIATQNGIKGIYTAFINEQGVPSIALMTSENTTDPNGVEIKFAVTDRWDFDKFCDEARRVYKFFKQRPIISGAHGFTFEDPKYIDKNIIPGVHIIDKSNGGYHSIAIMGNIAYPIEIPKADTTLGDLVKMLSCNLVIEFEIGELDFQASREGLSYIPETINSIKKKLEAVNKQLAIHIKNEADKISNEWERTYFLQEHNNSPLWREAVSKYITDTKFSLSNHFPHTQNILKFSIDELKNDYNILIRRFSKSTYNNTCENEKPWSINTPTGNKICWEFIVAQSTHFIINDTKVGATERAKYHYRKDKKHLQGMSRVNVTVIEPVDRTKPMKLKEFFAELRNPPQSQIFVASNLTQKNRAVGMNKDVTILQLERRQRNYRDQGYVWVDAGKLDSFDQTVTYYYLPLSGYQSLGIASDVKSLREDLEHSGIYAGTIYGVRKGDIESVKAKKNWVNLDSFVKDSLNKLDNSDVLGMVKEVIDFKDYFTYADKSLIKADSPLIKFASQFDGVKGVSKNKQYPLERLCKIYNVKYAQVDPTELIRKFKKEADQIKQRYPLISQCSSYTTKKQEVIDYINAIDLMKGI